MGRGLSARASTTSSSTVVEIFQNESGRPRRLPLDRDRQKQRLHGLAGLRLPITMTGTAVMHVREDGLLQHNWVERNALEVHRSLGGVEHVA